MALKRHKLTTKRHKTIRCYTTGPHKNIQITKKKDTILATKRQR